MPRIDNLLLSTDFDTLKNDDSAVVTIVIPGSDILSPGTKTYESTVSVGQPDSILVVSCNNSVTFPNGEYESISTGVRYDREGSVGGSGGFAYSIVIRYAHTGGSNVRVTASILNSYATDLTLAPTTESFTFRIRSIRVPRFS